MKICTNSGVLRIVSTYAATDNLSHVGPLSRATAHEIPMSNPSIIVTSER